LTARPFRTPALTGRLTAGGVGVAEGCGDGDGLGRVLVGGVEFVFVEVLELASGEGRGVGVGVGLGFGVGVGVFTLAFAFALIFVFMLLPTLKLKELSMLRLVGGLVLTLKIMEFALEFVFPASSDCRNQKMPPAPARMIIVPRIVRRTTFAVFVFCVGV